MCREFILDYVEAGLLATQVNHVAVREVAKTAFSSDLFLDVEVNAAGTEESSLHLEDG